MTNDTRVYVAGHTGLAGSAIQRRLAARGYGNIITRTRSELDLTRQSDVEAFFSSESPEHVYLAAAKVGGILANSVHPAEFIYANLAISTNVIHSAHKFGVKKLLNLGSSCIYPKHAAQPMKEECLLTGPLEPTNEAYAVAKIAAVKLCVYYNFQYGTDFISLMPTNLYGPGDNFDLESSHVLPALLRKFHEARLTGAREVVVWGSGSPRREFLYVDDLAESAVFLMENYSSSNVGEMVNVGTGDDITIKGLAELICSVVGYKGDIVFDTARPDGTPRKLLDVSRIRSLGWSHRISLEEGIRKVYKALSIRP